MVSRHLILKLYLWLLVALTVSVVGGAATVALLSPGSWRQRTEEFLRAEIGSLRDVTQILLAQGVAPQQVAASLMPLGREVEGRMSVQRADGRPLLPADALAEPVPELRLSDAERARVLAGEMVVRWHDHSWSNIERDVVALPIALNDGERGMFVVSFHGFRWGRHGVPWNLLGALGAVLLALGLLSWPLAAHLARPLQRMAVTADALGRGDLSARIGPRDIHRGHRHRPRQDEIGRLAQSFNTMAENLQRLVLGHKQLLADISHELRSPLARLRVALELTRGAKDSEQARYLEVLERQADAMESLIGELLFYARLEAAPHDLRLETVTPAALAAEALNAQRPEAEARSLRLDARITPGLPNLRADRRLLERALGNVLRNAIAVSPAGGRVELVITREPGRMVFTVTDEGPGLPPELLERVFEPFVRADAARSRSSGGVGLGLAIVRRCMLAHGGGAEASAGPDGRGLAVRLWVPLEAQA